MAKLSNRGEYYFDHIREAQMSHQFGGTYREARAMLEAVSKWADFNFDDWLDLPSKPRDIEAVTIGELASLLQNRITETEGYYRQATGVYDRDPLRDFVLSKSE